MKIFTTFLLSFMLVSTAAFAQFFMDGDESDWANVRTAIDAPDNTPGSYPADVKAAVNDIADVKEVKAQIVDDVLYTLIRFWGGPAWPNSAYLEERDGVMQVRHRGYYHLYLDLDNDPTTGCNSFYYEAHYTPVGYLASLGNPEIVAEKIGCEGIIYWGCNIDWLPVDSEDEPRVTGLEYTWVDASKTVWENDDDQNQYIAECQVPNPNVSKTMSWQGNLYIADSDLELFKDDSLTTFWAGHGWGEDFIELGMELGPFKAHFGNEYFQPGNVFGISSMIETPIDDWSVDQTTRGEVAYPGAAKAMLFDLNGEDSDWSEVPIAISAPDNTPGSYPADVKAAVNDVVDVKEVKAQIADDVLYTLIRFWGGPAWPNSAYLEERDGVMQVRHRGYYHLYLDLDNDPTTGSNSFYYEAHYTPVGYLASLGNPEIVAEKIGCEGIIYWGCNIDWLPVDSEDEPRVTGLEYTWVDASKTVWENDDDQNQYIAECQVPHPDVSNTMSWAGNLFIADSDLELFKDDSVTTFWAGHGWGEDFIELGMELGPFKAHFGDEYFQPGNVFGISPMVETPIDDWSVDQTTRGEVTYPGAAKEGPFNLNSDDSDWDAVPTAINAPDNTPGSYPADVKAAVADIVDVKEVKAQIVDDVLYTLIRFWGGPAWPNSAYLEERDGVMQVRHRGYYHLYLDLDNDPTTGSNSFYYEAHYTPVGYLASLGNPEIVAEKIGCEGIIYWGCNIDWQPVDSEDEPRVTGLEYTWVDASKTVWENDDDQNLYIAECQVPNPNVSKTMSWQGNLYIADSDIELFKDDSLTTFWAGHGWGEDFIELGMELGPFKAHFGNDYFQPGNIFGISPMIETPIDDWSVDQTTRGEVAYPGELKKGPFDLDGDETDWSAIPTAISAPDNTPGSYPADVKAAVADIVDVKEVKAQIIDDVLYTLIRFWGGPAWPNSAYLEERDGVMQVRHRGYYHLYLDLDNDITTGSNSFYYEAHYTPVGYLASLGNPEIVAEKIGCEGIIYWGCNIDWQPVDSEDEPSVTGLEYTWVDASKTVWENDDDQNQYIAECQVQNPSVAKTMSWKGYLYISDSDLELFKDDSVTTFWAGHGWGEDFIELGMELRPFKKHFGDEYFQPGNVFGISPMVETPIDDWSVDQTTRGEVVYNVQTNVDNEASIVYEFRLEHNYPNPFNPTTTIEFSIPKTSKVNLVVYNMLGQKVKTLVDKKLATGRHAITWDGTNDAGRLVSSGIYLYRLDGDSGTQVKKMTFLK